jgi:hypothetical protein
VLLLSELNEAVESVWPLEHLVYADRHETPPEDSNGSTTPTARIGSNTQWPQARRAAFVCIEVGLLIISLFFVTCMKVVIADDFN